MKLSLKIETGESCGFKITDLTQYDEFKSTETVSIVILGLCKSDAAIEYQPIVVDDHSKESIELFVPTKFDGHFQLNYVVLPNQLWYTDSNIEPITTSDIKKYYYDGNDIYCGDQKLSTSDFLNTVESLIKENPENPFENTTISMSRNDYVSICNLKKCFVSICTLVFKEKSFNPCSYRKSTDLTLLHTRDLAWMAINVISYLTEFNLLNEAERIIELLAGCNGICKSRDRGLDRSGCGCA